MEANRRSPDVIGGDQTVIHHWVSTYPFFQTTLHLVTCDGGGRGPSVVRVRLFDPDGALLRDEEVVVTGDGCEVPLGGMMEGCKIESGFKHAHLVLHLPSGVRSFCRLVSPWTGTTLGPPEFVAPESAAFYPVDLSMGRPTLFALLNCAPGPVNVRCRLLHPAGQQETVRSVPGFGVRLASLSDDFDGVAPLVGEVGYVKFMVRGADALVGVVMMEQTKFEGGSIVYSSVG
jgi:hypothetical protein